MSVAHYIFDSVEHVGAIGANLIASAENSSQIDCLWVETLSRSANVDRDHDKTIILRLLSPDIMICR